MNIDLTQFLIILCPRMKHFEITWITDTDLNKIVRFILIKTLTHTVHLHSLRFNIQYGRDEIVNEIQKIIDAEK